MSVQTDSHWQPTAGRAAIELRAKLLAKVRVFFAARQVLEVETPILSQAAVSDIHLESLATEFADPAQASRRRLYLQTSPEYAMKRLLAAGSGDIYQICKVFRDGERGRLHNPEFTMIEWYRRGFEQQQLMTEVDDLLQTLLAHLRLAATERVTYRDAMQRALGIDVVVAPVETLAALARSHGAVLPEALQDRDIYLDLLMSVAVGPRLGAGRMTFVHDYPASQAALARVRPGARAGEPAVAERFEAYCGGIELCNGFVELADAQEQARRFAADQQHRSREGQELRPLDENFLAALAAGLPDCAGVAVGFDRVLMLAAGASTLDAVLAFPVDRA